MSGERMSTVSHHRKVNWRYM